MGRGLATLLAMAALAIGGCGGDGGGSAADEDAAGGESAVASKPTQRQQAEATIKDDEKKKNSDDQSTEKKDEESSSSSEASDEPDTPEERADAIEAEPQAAKLRLVKQAASAATRLYGLKLANVELAKGAKSTKLLIAKRSACKARAGDQDKIAQQLLEAVPFLDTVAVEVDGTGQTLDSFASGCPAPQLPSGKGRVVFVYNGEGMKETKKFTVTEKKWVVEYYNGGGNLSVFVKKKGEVQPVVIVSQERGVGRKVVDIGPGTYTLSISGAASWTVRVRDGV